MELQDSNRKSKMRRLEIHPELLGRGCGCRNKANLLRGFGRLPQPNFGGSLLWAALSRKQKDLAAALWGPQKELEDRSRVGLM